MSGLSNVPDEHHPGQNLLGTHRSILNNCTRNL